ncbi:MAG: CsgG/HfaB family protein [Treponema sp.]|jgi:curli biogenesis system outer membrane secretion channel CsgG|nr:CsgG/HfaB family protein [Treponema sp.]
MKKVLIPVSVIMLAAVLVLPVYATGGVEADPAAQTPPSPTSTTPANSSPASNIEGALAKGAEQTLRNVPQRSKIAIVYITAQDRSTTDYIAGELEFIWVNEGFTLIDRSQLDRLRREQDFQMSGEIDDETAVSIGKFAGADIIVTGKIDGEGSLRRLRLRALDTQTAQVVGAASEAF